MSDDVLAPWITAYRRENPVSALDAESIKRRVLAGIGMRQRRRLKLLRFAVPVAAVFFGSVAMAASQGGLPRLDDVREWFGATSTEKAPLVRERKHDRRGPSSIPKPSERPAPESARPAVPPAVAAPSPEPSPAPAETLSLDDVPLRKTAPARVARPNPLGAELRVYQTAHRLHFDGGDPASTLAAWDRYLDAHPAGTFAPEARFNRAVCLLRLGRRAEARTVLVTIADSSFVYGRERARALLHAMGAADDRARQRSLR